MERRSTRSASTEKSRSASPLAKPQHLTPLPFLPLTTRRLRVQCNDPKQAVIPGAGLRLSRAPEAVRTTQPKPSLCESVCKCSPLENFGVCVPVRRQRAATSSKRKRKQKMSDQDASDQAAAANGGDTSPSDPTADAGGSTLSAEQRQRLEEQAALEMLEESEARQWGGPSHALHGLLRKLGAGLDDLLPSVSASHSRLKAILAGMKADDDGRQLVALSELCELLSIGTEESMSALSVDVFVPLLVQLLRKEHNADIMLLASRAMCHVMDVHPSSAAAIVHYDAVPILCEKLLSIEYIDLAEQCLSALEKLSHEHPLAILRGGGMQAVLQFVDFFATGVQRIAVSTAANLCRGLPIECAHLVADAVPLLSGLLNHHDQRVLEHVCLAFSRLVDDFGTAPAQLEMLAAHGLLPNLHRLVSGMVMGGAAGDAGVTLSDTTYTMLLRTLATICRGSGELCKQLLQLKICSLLRDGLMSEESVAPSSGLSVNRPPDQLFQILSLSNELLPPITAASGGKNKDVAATAAGSGAQASRAVAPKPRPKRAGSASPAGGEESEAPAPAAPVSERERVFEENPELLIEYGETLLHVLMQVYSYAVNPSVRQMSLSCLAKLLHFSSASHVSQLLCNVPFSAFIAALLSSQEPAAASSALQMAEMLLVKLPQIFEDKFLCEGVFHAVDDIRALAASSEAQAKSAAAVTASASTSASASASAPAAAPDDSLKRPSSSSRRSTDSDSAPPAAAAAAAAAAASSQATEGRKSLRRTSSGSRSSGSKSPELEPAAPASAAPAPAAPAPAPRAAPSTVTVRTDPAAALARRASSFHERFVKANSALSKIIETGDGSPTLRKLRKLSATLNDASLNSTLNLKVPLSGSLYEFADVKALVELTGLIGEGDGTTTTFEVANSGLIDALLRYLTTPSQPEAEGDANRRAFRLRAFCHVFFGLSPPRPVTSKPSSAPPPTVPPQVNGKGMQQLVVKLQQVLNMVERFPLVISESASGDGSSNGIKALTQPFKLRLQRGPGAAVALKEYASNVVLIEPLATVAAIEDFLWPKVRRDVSLKQTLRDAQEGQEGQEGGSGSGGGAPAAAPSSEGAAASGTGKQPASSEAKGEAPSSSGKSTQEAGDFFGGLAAGDMEDDAEDEDALDDDEGEEDDDDDEGSMLSSPGLGASLGDAECVHDLQLQSQSPAGSPAPSKGPPAYQLPSAAASSAAAAAPAAATKRASRSSAPAGAPAGAPSAAEPAPDGEGEGAQSHRLVLMLNGKPLPYGMTIFQAVREARLQAAESGSQPMPPTIGQRLWGDVYTITYRMRELESPSDTLLLTGAAADPSAVDPSAAGPGASSVSPVDALCKLPERLSDSEPAAAVVHLLWLLHSLSQGYRCLFDSTEQSAPGQGALLPQSTFLNRKLNAKLTRQLQDPLALCSRSLPPWCAKLTSTFSFLISFEARRLFLHSTAFGLSRALQRLQSQTQDATSNASSSSDFRVGRLPRQKVRISRSRVLDSALKVMELYAGHKALLEVEYFNEVGTGLGPTLEFYTLVSRELQRTELGLWRHESGGPPPQEGQDGKPQQYVHAPAGLFPAVVKQDQEGGGVPPRTLQLFTFMGRFVAKALLDNRLVDLPFSAPLMRSMLGARLGLSDLQELSPQVAASLGQLQQLSEQRAEILRGGGSAAEQQQQVQALTLQGCPVSDLGLDFTLPGEPTVELCEGGAERDVGIDDLEEYVQAVLNLVLRDGVRAQVEAFRKGFSEVLPVHHLRAFTPEELDLLFNGSRDAWERDAIVESLKFDHGYTRSSGAVGFLLGIMCEFTDAERRQFLKVRLARQPCPTPGPCPTRAQPPTRPAALPQHSRALYSWHACSIPSRCTCVRQFVTGSPRLPVGGLSRMVPRLTIVKKSPESGNSPDAYLPSVMTCANYLKLPDYSSKEVMRERLLTAINEGQGCFLLS